jgi:DNA primase
MARIPEPEIERLKSDVSIVRLVEAAGIALKPHGKDRVGRCPFHDDKTPSLVVSPHTNLWHCLGACQIGGSVIDWVMKFEGVSFRHAVERLRREIGESGLDAARPDAPTTTETALAAVADDDAALMRRVIDFYHATLKQSPEAKRYLQARGIDSSEAIDTFKLGFANRTLGYRVPDIQVKAGAKLRAALQRVGLYRETGREHFNGSLVVPVIGLDGNVTEVYGRKIGGDTKLRAGTPLHLYLPGPHKGVFNEAGLIGQSEIILCEALIDALTFWCAGYRNVTASYGIEGFTEDHLDAFTRHGVQRVLIAYDRDDAGNAAAEKLATKLMAAGFACYRVLFPKGMDANAYALAVQPASKSLGLVIRQAEWLGKGAAPRREPVTVNAPAPADVLSLAAAVEVEAEPVEPPMLDVPAMPEPPAYRVPPTAVPLPVAISDSGELVLTLGDRMYRVRGIEKNLSYEQLKVLVRASCHDFVHVDTLELYQAKQRLAWAKAASIELGVAEDVVKADLGKLLLAIEQRQDTLIRAKLKPSRETTGSTALSPAQHDAAMTLLRDPHLIARIVADVEATGVVGEASNALVAYLACVSRKLDKPLAILIQSTSAAGKSTLMDALLALMPEPERVHYSAMTGQSLFYLGETSMKHKILAIAEEEGVRQAAYALKVLQSQGELTIASTGKDPATGDLQTKTYTVEGPVMLFLTTTAIDIDEELLNRCLVLTINESREQTAAIQAKQRASRTLSGLLTKARSNDILDAHRAAQSLLRPLAVVNPFAEQLTFASDRVRLRRDHQKYLSLIDAIALLHQYQRPVRSATHGGKTIDYIEVMADDIALANRLAHDVLGRSLDELPPQTRRVLGHMQQFVIEHAKAQAIEPGLVRFTRRALRDAMGMSEKQLRVHVDRLVALDYVIPHAGRNGQRFVYELAFDGDVASDAPQAIGLSAVEGLTTTVNLVGIDADLVGRSWSARGQLVGTSSGHETPRIARTDAVLLPLVAAVDQTALPGEPRAKRRNGASYADLNAHAQR